MATKSIDETRKMVNHVLDSLESDEAQVLRLRFGLIDGVVCTLEETAQKMSKPIEEIEGLEWSALEKVRSKDHAEAFFAHIE